MEKIEKIFNGLFEKKTSLLAWILGFLGIIFVRCFIEQFLAFSKPMSAYDATVEYIHNFYFFSLAIILIWLFLSLLLKIKPQKLSGIMVFSLVIVIFPPLIDMVKTGGEIYWSFYLFSAPRDLFLQYITVFSYLPSAIVYFGTKITFLLVIFLLCVVVWIKSKNILKTISTAIVVYSILFFLGAFPSLFFYAFFFFSGQNNILEIQAYQIAQFFGGINQIMGISFPAIHYALALAYRLNFVYFIGLIMLLMTLFWRIDKEKFIAVIKNFRYAQVFYHSGLLFIGIAVGAWGYKPNFRFDIFSVLAVVVLLISVWLAWKASVVVNDLNDAKIDCVSNPQRPLQQEIFSKEEYSHFGLACFLLSILGGLTLGFPFAALLVVYQVIAWVYSAEPFRMKRFPVIATLTSSLASLMIMFLGFILLADNQTVYTLSPRIIFLMIIAGTLSLPIKDFKDIIGDKKDNVWTIPVVFGEKNARTIVASGIFISFILSVFFLNERRLFWWAMLFGSLAFLAVVSKKIKPRQIFWPVLGIISFYGIIMVWVLFF
jgi:4-hydroxybenzoate polyprenyltransferase